MNVIAHLRALAVAFALLAASSVGAQASDIPRTPTFPGMESAAVHYSTPEEVGVSQDELNRFGNEIAGWVSDGFIVGAELLLIKDGHAFFHESYGWSDREEGRPMERGSIFRMRSMTKPVLGTAVLMLMEEGRLSLDDPAAKYLPSFDTDKSRSITVRQLLTHTSGLGDHSDYHHGLQQPAEAYPTLRALVDEIGGIGPLLPAGSFKYSDSGSATLGAIVAEISGMPLERFIETRILEPLRMVDTHTLFTPDAPWANRMNSTYRRMADTCVFKRYWAPSMTQEFPYFRASGGLYSTTMDYARFMTMWMNKGQYRNVRMLSERTVETALHPYAEARRGHYGMHWTVLNPAPVDGLPAVFGHRGSDGTLAIAMPERNAVALYFTQSRDNPSNPSTNRFLYQLSQLSAFGENVISPLDEEIEAQWAEARARALEEPSGGTRPVASTTKDLERYSGTYLLDDFENVVTIEEGRLRFAFEEGAESSPLLPLSDKVFLMQNACTGTVARVTFDVGTGGKVDGYRIEANDGWSGTFKKRRG